MGVQKNAREIVKNSMPEDEINQNCAESNENKKIRWGPSHAGAKELASGYTTGTYVLALVYSCLILHATQFL